MGPLRSGRGLLIAAAAVLVCLLAAGALLLPRFLDKRQAEALFQAGDYAGARELYLKTGDAEAAARCEEILLQARYHEARQKMSAGEYRQALSMFEELGDYQESRRLIPECRFLLAGALCETGELDEAKEIYLSLGDYPGCAEALERMPALYYDKALSLARAFELEEACGIWRELGDFRNCETLLKRGERILKRTSDRYRTKLTDPARAFFNEYNDRTFAVDEAYIVAPEHPDGETRFFVYFPGGRDEELNLDFFYAYLENPAPNTLAVFMRKNDLPDMKTGCQRALGVLERAAADLGLFVDRPVVAGSSLGVYPAVQFPRYAWHGFGIQTSCVLSLDAGNDWWEPLLAPDEEAAREIALIGTELILFQSPELGTDNPVIQRFVKAGDMVTIIECLRDEHEQITVDALGSSGIIDWALGDRDDAFSSEYYRYYILS